MTRNRPPVEFKKLEGRALPDDVEGLTDLKSDTIRPDVPDREAVARPNFTVEWGIRTTDGALVIHFYPKIDGENVATEWDGKYRMPERLELAIPKIFDVNQVTCGFEKDFNSFYVIVGAVISIDLRLLVQRFLELVEGAALSR